MRERQMEVANHKGPSLNQAGSQNLENVVKNEGYGKSSGAIRRGT